MGLNTMKINRENKKFSSIQSIGDLEVLKWD